MRPATNPTALRVQAQLDALGMGHQIVEFEQTTRTAADAAAAIGCQVGQIVKTLVFRGATSGQAVLALVSGANRASEQRLAALVGEPIGKADADFVRATTGYAIGGVCPVGLPEHVHATFIDQDLNTYSEIWAAGGTPASVFKLTPDDLRVMTRGIVGVVCG
ncbi:MAG: YbaK/EbsC family protein [Anaerolineae bacterium]|nr:YbaK/EbsC family protein [Anaerolineae bacterium]